MYNIDVFTTLNIAISNSHLVLKEQLKEAMDELGRLREARERQKEMVKAIVNQRDMYQRLLAQATPLPAAGDEVRVYIVVCVLSHIHAHIHTYARTHTYVHVRTHTITYAHACTHGKGE